MKTNILGQILIILARNNKFWSKLAGATWKPQSFWPNFDNFGRKPMNFWTRLAFGQILLAGNPWKPNTIGQKFPILAENPKIWAKFDMKHSTISAKYNRKVHLKAQNVNFLAQTQTRRIDQKTQIFRSNTAKNFLEFDRKTSVFYYFLAKFDHIRTEDSQLWLKILQFFKNLTHFPKKIFAKFQSIFLVLSG